MVSLRPHNWGFAGVCYPETLALQGAELARSKREDLQRLFTMFPGGWPGAGLLVLRLSAAIPLLVEGCSEFSGLPHFGLYAGFIAIGVGSLLLAGLWTPIAGFLQAMIEVWTIFARGIAPGMHVLLAALGVSLVMLGPGAWSVDARLFGRKRIDIRRG
jgi:putative oxidoreductase